ncbi:C-X-C motif chemokine 11-6-like [Brachionichthys hirsutus]|uniref:C-X-C motif chemokine 11-6-like n=1 Tax=Brachionichthys hirsutus TaxID=412623 RepID=UPI00360442DB
MSSIMKVLFALAAMICIAKAQHRESGSQCLCQRFSKSLRRGSEIQDIQIYRATLFCNKVEILVTTKGGGRYCLIPTSNLVKRLLSKIIKQKTSTVRPTEFIPSITSTNAVSLI